MYIVKLSATAEETLDLYFETYRQTGYETDMLQRAYNYSQILFCLSRIDIFLDKIYVIDRMNFIDISKICTVRFAIADNNVLIEDIYFNLE